MNCKTWVTFGKQTVHMVGVHKSIREWIVTNKFSTAWTSVNLFSDEIERAINIMNYLRNLKKFF